MRRTDGSLATNQEELETEVLEFYSRLFTHQEMLDPGPILEYVPAKVAPQMNDSLLRPFTGEEVRDAVFMMGASKAPGPDGLTAGFYQHHWELLGPGVTTAVLDFLNGGVMPESINRTTVVLIPKIKCRRI